MTTQTVKLQHAETKPATYRAEQISLEHPFQWIRKGVQDFRTIPGLSLLYGVIFASLCSGVYLLMRELPWYTLGYLTGLMVIGPFLASGLYVASRDMERGTAPSITGGLRFIFQRRTYLALFSLALALVMSAWIRFSALLFAVKFSALSPSASAYTSIFSSADGWVTLSYFIGSGFILAFVVYTLSAIAIPLILDRDTDFITAMKASYQAVTRNSAAMAVWAGIIVAMTAVGVATGFLGMIVVFPVLGYATWHSYRALLK